MNGPPLASRRRFSVVLFPSFDEMTSKWALVTLLFYERQSLFIIIIIII